MKFAVVFGLILGLITTTAPLRPFQFAATPHFPKMPINAENPTTEQGFELGRYLFYDTILSIDSSVSCASCHKQEFAFADSLAFSKGVFQQTTQRNSMPLFNLRWSRYFFWDGRAEGLENQIFEPIKHPKEMGLDWDIAVERISKNLFYSQQFAVVFPQQHIDSTRIVYAIAQFLSGLISTTSKYDSVVLRKAAFSQEEYEGYELVNDMTKGNCLLCHSTDGDGLGTNFSFANNGLSKMDEQGNFLDNGLAAVTGKKTDKGRFKVPSFRNLYLTAPYMHDGRFQTVEQVLDFYSEGIQNNPNIDPKISNPHKGGQRLTDKEKAKIIAFLKTMTDWSFKNNPRFANPF